MFKANQYGLTDINQDEDEIAPCIVIEDDDDPALRGVIREVFAAIAPHLTEPVRVGNLVISRNDRKVDCTPWKDGDKRDESTTFDVFTLHDRSMGPQTGAGIVLRTGGVDYVISVKRGS